MTSQTVAEMPESADEKTDPYLSLFENIATHIVSKMSERALRENGPLSVTFREYDVAETVAEMSVREGCVLGA